MKNQSKQTDFEPHPLNQIVSIEEFLAYDPEKPEIKTVSPLINAVAEAFYAVKPLTGRNVSKYLDVNINKLSVAIEVIIGMNFKELHDVWLRHRRQELMREHPYWSNDDIAKAMGFKDRSALWRLLHRDKRKKTYHDDKLRFKEYMRTVWNKRLKS